MKYKDQKVQELIIPTDISIFGNVSVQFRFAVINRGKGTGMDDYVSFCDWPLELSNCYKQVFIL